MQVAFLCHFVHSYLTYFSYLCNILEVHSSTLLNTLCMKQKAILQVAVLVVTATGTFAYFDYQKISGLHKCSGKNTPCCEKKSRQFQQENNTENIFNYPVNKLIVALYK